MKLNKFNKIDCILAFIQATLFEVFSLYVLIPKFALIVKAVSEKYNNPFYFIIKESNNEMFVFVFWFIILLVALFFEVLAITVLRKSYQKETSNCNDNSTFQAPVQTSSSKTTSSQPSENEWKCSKCGKINQNYVGTCGCGELKK